MTRKPAEPRQDPYWWRKPVNQTAARPSFGEDENDIPQTAVNDAGELCLLVPPKPGDLCPFCGEGVLAYDGLFLLGCPVCKKIAEGGCFT